MMIQEFEERTGFHPSMELYDEIEKAYMESDLDKDTFCKDYKQNKNGIAEAIARRATISAISESSKAKKEAAGKISELEKQVQRLTEQLERELEWKPYEMRGNVSQADYAKLAQGAESGKFSHYMTDEEAKDWICNEFDFDRSKITIIHEVDEWEINRHSQLRKTGKKIDRRPVYCATDYHYIRFNTSRWYYEVWNDQLRPYYC